MGCRQSKMETANEEAKKSGDVAAEAATGPAGDENAPKVIVVFGGTGLQGGSVVRFVKTDEAFKLRIVTRNPESEKAKSLSEQGLEVVKGDLNDPDSMKRVLEGAYGAFLVTDYWESVDMEKEIQQGKNAIDAAKECKVQHLVFSGSESVKDSMGKACEHFESKAVLEKYIEDQKLPFTIVRIASYYENLLNINFCKPRKNEDGDYVLDIPMGDEALDMICVDEIGECIHQIFKQPSEFMGKTLGLSSQKFKVEEYAAIMSKAFEGKKIIAGSITTEDFSKLGFPGAPALSVMYEYYRSGKCHRDIEITRKLNPSISPFEQWVDNNHDAIAALLN